MQARAWPGVLVIIKLVIACMHELVARIEFVARLEHCGELEPALYNGLPVLVQVFQHAYVQAGEAGATYIYSCAHTQNDAIKCPFILAYHS